MPVERYQKEDASGFFELEDGSGVFLLESSSGGAATVIPSISGGALASNLTVLRFRNRRRGRR